MMRWPWERAPIMATDRPPADKEPVPAALFERVVAFYESALAMQRDTARRALDELASSRAQHGEQISSLINQVMELKRDGLVLQNPGGPTINSSDVNPADVGDEMPDEIWEAITERSENQVPAVKRTLIDFARKELRAARRAESEAPEVYIARIRNRILEGEDPE